MDTSICLEEEDKIIAIYKTLEKTMNVKGLTFESIKKFQTFLSDPFSLREDKKKTFEPNSPDTILLLLHTLLTYGKNSEEYKNVRDDVYTGSGVDHQWVEVFFESFHTEKRFHPPEKSVYGLYYDEGSDENCYPLKSIGRVVLVSDWAMGTPDAIHTLKCIASMKPDYFIHLGDVYYSGTPIEQKKNFVDPVKMYLPHTRIFNLPGNHDYYSGSQGIEYTLSHINQHSTFFSLYNDYLQFQGMDTGYNDSDYKDAILSPHKNPTFLEESEKDWHIHRCNIAKKKSRKVILLSHHQPISNVTGLGVHQNKKSPVNNVLVEQLSTAVLSQSVAWFFGHDHMFNIFEDYCYVPLNSPEEITIKKPRLIGNGACQARSGTLEENETHLTLSFGIDPFLIPPPKVKNILPGSFMGLLNSSFVVIDFSPEKINATYYEIPRSKIGKYKDPRILFEEEL